MKFRGGSDAAQGPMRPQGARQPDGVAPDSAIPATGGTAGAPHVELVSHGRGQPLLTHADFLRIRALLGEVAGLRLRDGKEPLVRARLQRRLLELGLSTVGEYLERVAADESGEERALLVERLTTNKTSFFREPAHFQLLGRQILPALARKPGEMRLWSAGCSTGEEAYSMAIVAREVLGDAASRVRILASDISARVVDVARAGEYGLAATKSMSAARVARHFEQVQRDGVDRLRIVNPTRELVEAIRLNLMSPWPMREEFDVIFCRNVMIYFDHSTRERLVERFVKRIRPGGYLVIGHSENLSSSRQVLRYAQPAVYQV